MLAHVLSAVTSTASSARVLRAESDCRCGQLRNTCWNPAGVRRSQLSTARDASAEQPSASSPAARSVSQRHLERSNDSILLPLATRLPMPASVMLAAPVTASFLRRGRWDAMLHREASVSCAAWFSSSTVSMGAPLASAKTSASISLVQPFRCTWPSPFAAAHSGAPRARAGGAVCRGCSTAWMDAAGPAPAGSERDCSVGGQWAPSAGPATLLQPKAHRVRRRGH
mmetsp:Transcript_12338/g.31563  ORF Transcript_12338/g.31563 Transcript_12338/m.31563 type:complete len:226 (-) Transcript_12338:536-1213(-)